MGLFEEVGKAYEGFKDGIYLDHEKVPTIGVGYNLRNPDVLEGVLKQFGYSDDSLTETELSELVRKLSDIFNSKDWTEANKNTKISDINDILEDYKEKMIDAEDKDAAHDTFVFKDKDGKSGYDDKNIPKTANEMEPVFAEAIKGFEKKIVARIKSIFNYADSADAQAVWDGLGQSQKDSVLSLIFNGGPKIMGTKLATALRDKNWADAYFEIVYGSNREKDYSGDKKVDGRSYGLQVRRIAEGAKFIDGISAEDKKKLFNKLKDNKKTIEKYLDAVVDLPASGGYRELSKDRHDKLFNDLNDFMDDLRSDLAEEGIFVNDVNFNSSKVILSPNLHDVDQPARVDPAPPNDPEPVDPPDGEDPKDPPTDPEPVDPAEPSTPPADPIISIKETKKDGYTLTEVYFNDDSGTSKILMAVPDFNPEGTADSGYLIGFPNSNNHVASILRNPDGTVTYRFVDKNGNAATDLTLGADGQSIDLNYPLKGADGEWIRWEDAIKMAPLPEPEPPHLPPPPPRDPLALDLNGDGVVKTLPMSRGIHFDLDNSGFAERTSWVAPEDGLLVLDRNNNNFIDGGAELFGTETLLSNGKYAKHGFEALAEFDLNQDGAVDANDTVYSTLRVWQDSNSNGVADSGELKTLNELNIKSIATAHTNTNTLDANNVDHREAGTFSYNNATQGITNTLWFESDRRITVPVTELQGNAPISDAIKKLPNAIGFGNTYSLHQAMAVDVSGALQKKVQRFSVELNPEKRRELLREILVLWTGTGSIIAGSRGDEVDATSLAIMESFWGQPAVQDKPFGEYATSVNQAYLHLEQSIYSQLMAGSHMRDLLGLSNFTEVNGSWSADYSLVVDLILNDLLSGDEFSPGKLIEFVEVVRGINPYSTEMVAPLLTTIVGNAAVLSAAERDTIINALYAENLIIKNVASGGAITGNNADNLMYGSEATDQMRGNSGEDILIGESGNDTLYGMDDADHLIGGSGGDWLEGGAGDDAYYYRLGDGADTIKESSGFDSITFGEGINALNIKVIRLLDNIIFEMPDGGSIFIQDFRDHFGNVNAGAIERIRFINNKEWDLSEIAQRSIHTSELDDHLSGYSLNDTIHAGGGDDRIVGLSGDDDLAGGSGSDFIYGGSGHDIYRFSRGDGIDLIEDSGGFDTLVFSDIKSTDVYVHRIGGDNYFILKNGEMVRVSGFLNGGELDKGYQIEKVIFADTVWDAATIEQKVLESRALANVKFGSNSWDEIDISTASSVEIYGLDGDDYLQGGAGNDTIDGGAGLNFLEGREGRDTYLIGENISKNFIENFRGDADRVLFAEGISPDEVRVRLIPGRDESYLEKGVLYKYIIPHNRYWNLELVSGDSVTYIDSLFKYDPQTYGAELENASLQVGSVEFFDGTVWTYSDLIRQALKASSVDDAINGTIAADLVNGLEGADTIKSYSGNDSVNGGAGDDRIETGRDNDDITGGFGNDSLSDESGNDLYRFATGDGVDTISDLHGLDVLVFGAGITKEQTFLTADGNDQIVTFANSTDKIIIKNGALPAGNNYTDQRIEIFRFENGDEWNFDPKSIPQRKEGNANDEVLVGGYGNDTLIGNQGNDTLQGEAGDDEYHYKTGDGFDLIQDTGGTDKVILGAGITSDKVSIRRSFNAFIVSLDGQDAFTIGNPYSTEEFDGDAFIESLVFSATGEVWDQQTIISKSLTSTSGNDTLYGSHLSDVILSDAGNDELYAAQGNDTLIGGVGNDYLVGGKGDDVYRFEQGAGTDVINDITGNDAIEFGSGILPADISVTRNEFDLILKVKNSNPITINGFFESTGSAIRSVNLIQAIEEVVFSTRERWSLDQLLGKISFLGTDSANMIYGLDTNNLIDSKGGNDSVFAGGGNDTLIGGAGVDRLHGEAGDDLLQGGDGNDWLYDAYGNNIFEGGKGNDIISMSYPGIGQQAGSSIIRFSLGDGVDEIEATTLSPVVIELGAGITADMLAFKSYFVDESDGSVENKNRIDLLIPGKADQINKLLDNGSYSFKFADNTYWNGEQVVKAINQSKAFLSNDRRVIIGSARPNSKISISYLNKDNTLTKYPIIQSDATGSYQLDFGFGIVDTKRIIISSQDSSGNILPITVFGPAIDMSIPPAPTAELDSSGYVINGFARPGTSIHVLTNGNHLGYASTDKITGAYSFISPLRLVHGETISVLSIVSGLIESPPATILVPNSSVAADSMPPSIPTGNFDPQGTSISGSAEPGTLVFITPVFGSRVLGSAIVGQNGSYSIQLSESIIDGSSVRVVSVDQANNRSYGEIKSSDLTIPMPVSAKFDTTGKYISGSAESSVTGGHQVVVMNSTNTTVLGTIMLPAYESNYKITLTTALKNNEQVNVYVKDAAGNTSYATAINAPDTTKPLVPEAAFDTTGKYITGKAEPGSTVIVKNAAGTQLETATANAATGEYSITLSTALINKETVKITAKDAAGNVSDIKSLIAPDKTPPAPPTASINSTRKVITGSAEAGSIVEVKNTSGSLLGSVTANATTGAYSVTLGTALTVNQTVNITAKDKAGNISLPKALTVSAVAKNLIPSSVFAARFDLGSMIANYEAEFENDAVFENSKMGRVADETIAMYDELKNLRSGGVNIDSLVQAIASFDPTAGMSLHIKSLPIDQQNLMLAVES